MNRTTKILGFLLVAAALGGCRTFNATVDKVAGIGHAVVDTVDVLKEPAKDVNDIWNSTLGGDDAATPAAPAPGK